MAGLSFVVVKQSLVTVQDLLGSLVVRLVVQLSVQAPCLLSPDLLFLVLDVHHQPLLLLSVDQVHILLHALYLPEDALHLVGVVALSWSLVLVLTQGVRQRVSVEVSYVLAVLYSIVFLTLLIKQPLDLFIRLLSEVRVDVVLLNISHLVITELLNLSDVPYIAAPVLLRVPSDLSEHDVNILVGCRVNNLAVVNATVLEVPA